MIKNPKKPRPVITRFIFRTTKSKWNSPRPSAPDFTVSLFPKTDRGVVLLDRGAGEGSVEIVGDHTMRGQGARGRRVFRRGIFQAVQVVRHFPAKPSRPRWRAGAENDVTTPDSRAESGSYAGGYLNFSTAEGEPVLVKIAAGPTFEQARQKLASENPGWDFDAIRQRAPRMSGAKN
jgi:hypothetical protein